MAHIIIPEAEELLDQEIRVLDKGFVRLVDYMGGDQRIVQSARVSYGAGTKTIREDRGLIHYLLRNAHTSPFEQVILTFHTKMPIFVARQWVRHRTARLNEMSARYSVMPDEFYIPEPTELRYQDNDKKQARANEALPLEVAESIREEMREDQSLLYKHYQEMLDRGLAREVARVNLPVSLYTQWYWQIDLHNLLHFLRLRMDPHAQYEIRVYAEAMAQCAKAVAPMAYEAFEDHVLSSVRFSREECEALTKVLEGGANPLEGRKLAMFEEKLERMRKMVNSDA